MVYTQQILVKLDCTNKIKISLDHGDWMQSLNCCYDSCLEF